MTIQALTVLFALILSSGQTAFAAGSFGQVSLGSLRSTYTPAIDSVAVDGQSPVRLIRASASAAPIGARTTAGTMNLESERNAHFRRLLPGETPATLNGRQVYVSGIFDRTQNAFLSVWVDGEAAPTLFNIMSLLNAPGRVTIGGKAFEVEILGALPPLRSQIHIFDPVGNEETSLRLEALISRIENAGTSVRFGGADYKIFYTDGVGEGPVLNPQDRLLSIIHRDAAGDIHVFLVPENLVPTDRIAIFNFINNARGGLRKNGATLEIYDNP